MRLDHLRSRVRAVLDSAGALPQTRRGLVRGRRHETCRNGDLRGWRAGPGRGPAAPPGDAVRPACPHTAVVAGQAAVECSAGRAGIHRRASLHGPWHAGPDRSDRRGGDLCAGCVGASCRGRVRHAGRVHRYIRADACRPARRNGLRGIAAGDDAIVAAGCRDRGDGEGRAGLASDAWVLRQLRVTDRRGQSRMDARMRGLRPYAFSAHRPGCHHACCAWQ